jgi:hypothetical protein
MQKEQEETVQTIVMSSDRFKVTQEMLEVDENTMQKPVKDMEHLELVLVNIPMKELYGLQVSVMQEVQSRARVDATNLALDREVKEILQVTCEQITLEKEEEKQHADNLEKKLAEVYSSIPDCAGTRGYNRREDTEDCTDNGEIQTRDSGLNREINSEHTSRSTGTEREGGYCTRR